MTLKCPKCYHPIDPAEAARLLGSRGGNKSKRKITPEQQAKMQAGRRNNATPCGRSSAQRLVENGGSE